MNTQANPIGADVLTQLRQVFPYTEVEKKGSFWYVPVERVLDRANEVLGLAWSFEAGEPRVRPSTEAKQDNTTREGYEAIVSGHVVIHLGPLGLAQSVIRRPGSDSFFHESPGNAIKGATSGAIVKAFSTLGVGRELYGKVAPRRDELEMLGGLDYYVKEANKPGETDGVQRQRAAAINELDKVLTKLALALPSTEVDVRGEALLELISPVSAEAKANMIVVLNEKRHGIEDPELPYKLPQSAHPRIEAQKDETGSVAQAA